MQNVSQSHATNQTPSGIAITVEQAASSAQTFLEKRKLTFETTQRYGIKESNGSIVIPFVKAGLVKNNKYRSTTEKKFWQDGGTQFAWNYDCLFDASLADAPLVITEGEFDALTAIQCGYVKTISVPNGGTEGNVNLAWLEEIDEKLPGEIILALDNDDVGANLIEAISVWLGKARCRWAKYPTGCKDLNDVLVKHGEQAVNDCLKNAAWMKVGGVYDMDELPPLPYRKPMSAGMSKLDNHLRLRLGDFSVWTGIPGHGKTTFINDFTNRIIDKYDLKICFASFEQAPQGDHQRSLRTWKIGKLVKNSTPEEIKTADAWIKKRFKFIVPDDNDFVTMEWLMARLEEVVVQNGVKIIVIDPWNEMDHARAKGETLTEYTGRAIRQLKSFAKSRGVHIAVVAHPAKPPQDYKSKGEPPTLYSISDSANWANKADVGIVIHRSPEGDTVQIVKSRHHTEIGEPGKIDIKFNFENARFQVVDNQVLNGG